MPSNSLIYKKPYVNDKITYANASTRTECFRKDDFQKDRKCATNYVQAFKLVLNRDYFAQLKNKVDAEGTLPLNIVKTDYDAYYLSRRLFTNQDKKEVKLVLGPKYLNYNIKPAYIMTQGVVISCSAYSSKLASLALPYILNEYILIANKLGLSDTADFAIQKSGGFFLSKETFFPVFARLTQRHLEENQEFTDEFNQLIKASYTPDSEITPLTNSISVNSEQNPSKTIITSDNNNNNATLVSAVITPNPSISAPIAPLVNTVTTNTGNINKPIGTTNPNNTTSVIIDSAITSKTNEKPPQNSNSIISTSLATNGSPSTETKESKTSKIPEQDPRELEASSDGIMRTLYERFKDTVHIINPEIMSVFNFFDKENPEKAEEAVINVAKEIVGFQAGKEYIQGQILKNKGDELTKPIIFIFNTSAINVKPEEIIKADSVAGKHWVSCVILPKNYLNNGAPTELIYVLDSSYLIKNLPAAFIDILKNGKTISFKSPQDEKNPCLIERSHIIPPAFPNAKIADTEGFSKQQKGHLDCGLWAIDNAISIIENASINKIIKENERGPRTADQLREAYPYATTAENFKIKIQPPKADVKNKEIKSETLPSKINSQENVVKQNDIVSNNPSASKLTEEERKFLEPTPLLMKSNTEDLLKQTQQELTEADAQNKILQDELFTARLEIQYLKHQLSLKTVANNKELDQANTDQNLSNTTIKPFF